MYFGDIGDRVYQFLEEERTTRWVAETHDIVEPNCSQIIQYFTCKQFVEKKPFGRFNVIKSKGLGRQCLFLGALVKHGKHNEKNVRETSFVST